MHRFFLICYVAEVFSKEEVKSRTTNVTDYNEPIQTPMSQQEEKIEKGKKEKEKKWKNIPLSDLGFNMSLFPRPTRPEKIDPEEEEKLWQKIEQDLDDYDRTVEKYKDFDVNSDEVFEGKSQRRDKLARKDRDRKITKAFKQVKDKYCTSVRNNKGRKRLFIHHRLFKLINLEDKRLYLHIPSRSKLKASTNIANGVNKASTETKSRLLAAVPVRKSTPAQNLRFALESHNAASGLESDLVNVLINLQHRELTPEDYETLLRLDDTVAPKTIDKSLLSELKTDTVTDATAGDVCAVCMEIYELGQTRKFLPCAHVFHAKCIDMWLENSSRNCPIDGLPIDDHS